MKKPLILASFAALALSTAAHAQTVKPLKLDEKGCVHNLKVKKGDRFSFNGEAGALLNAQSTARFAVHNADGEQLQTQNAHDGDTGKTTPFIELDGKGGYLLAVLSSGRIKTLCVGND
ncbi:MAG: hypothetical protein Q3966_08650 [Neisseria sp.]|nr:hypothetical protein [Neisseria sp.]